MSSTLLRVPVPSLGGGELRLDRAASRYVRRVHRLGRGDTIIVFDPEGHVEARALIIDDSEAGCLLCVEEPVVLQAPPPLHRCLVQAAGKGDKLDTVVRDATALGVTTLVLLDADRSVRRLSGSAGNKVERWRRICIEAARQCGRADVPNLEIAGSFADALGIVEGAEVRWILEPRAQAQLGDLLPSVSFSSELAVFVGPEGGWTPAELEAATTAGLEPVRAWPYVLRTETAATALLGAISAVLDRQQAAMRRQ